MAGGQDDRTAAVPGEHAFVFPAAWRKLVHPRRGGIPGPALNADATPGAELVRAASSTIKARLAHPTSDPLLVKVTEAYLADPATGSATGAGVVAGLVAADIGWQNTDQLSKVADAWVATRGVVFAAEAAVHTAGLDLGGYWNGSRQVEPRLAHRTGDGWGYFPHWVALAGRVRAHLATAPDDEYAAAIVALEALRAQSLQRQAASSFLLPTQQSWVDADCAALNKGGDHFVGKLLWCSATTSEQLNLLAPHIDGWWMARETAVLATVAEGVGPAIAPHLFTWLDKGNADADVQQRLLGALAHFPTDEALGGLIARLDRKYVPLAALEAARRFPRRALRLLAADNGRPAGNMLRVHVRANQELAASELESLTPAARVRVEAILAEPAAVPEAPAEVLPPVLVTPPWTVKRPAAKPVVVTGLDFAEAPVMAWAAGEREAWAATRPPTPIGGSSTPRSRTPSSGTRPGT